MIETIERVWILTRTESPYNPYFNDLDELKMAVIHRFSRWTDSNDGSRRSCAVI
jgi:hypothetical protein